MNVFVRLCREIYGIDRAIIESPPRIALQMFGGPFDIETFRTEKNICELVTPPFVSYCMLIEERLPTESMGETRGIQNTVKGLRRPIPGSVMVDEDALNGEGDRGAFSSFFKSTDNERNTDKTDVANPKPQKKAQKKTLNSDVTTSQGLGRFMSKKQ